MERDGLDAARDAARARASSSAFAAQPGAVASGLSPRALIASRTTETRTRRREPKRVAHAGHACRSGRMSHGATRRRRRTGAGGTLGAAAGSATTRSAPPSKGLQQVGEVLGLVGEVGLHEHAGIASRIARARGGGAQRARRARRRSLGARGGGSTVSGMTRVYWRERLAPCASVLPSSRTTTSYSRGCSSKSLRRRQSTSPMVGPSSNAGMQMVIMRLPGDTVSGAARSDVPMFRTRKMAGARAEGKRRRVACSAVGAR